MKISKFLLPAVAFAGKNDPEQDVTSAFKKKGLELFFNQDERFGYFFRKTVSKKNKEKYCDLSVFYHRIAVYGRRRSRWRIPPGDF